MASIAASSLSTLLAASVLALAAPASAQQAFGWSAAFGGRSLPSNDPDRLVSGVAVNLFTELAKELDGSGNYLRYNDIPATIGVTELFAQLTRGNLHPRFPLVSTLHLGVAIVDDLPTSLLQNDFLHVVIDAPFVPRDSTVSAYAFTLAADQSFHQRWAPWASTWQSAGLSSSVQLYTEAYVQGGLRLALPKVREGVAGSYVSVDVVGRLGTIADCGSEWCDWLLIDELEGQYASRYGTVALGAEADVGDLFGPPGALIVSTLYTRSTGVFREAGGNDALPEQFITFRIDLPTFGLSIETWNDIVNRKDFGPTFGLTVSTWR